MLGLGFGAQGFVLVFIGLVITIYYSFGISKAMPAHWIRKLQWAFWLVCWKQAKVPSYIRGSSLHVGPSRFEVQKQLEAGSDFWPLDSVTLHSCGGGLQRLVIWELHTFIGHRQHDQAFGFEPWATLDPATSCPPRC